LITPAHPEALVYAPDRHGKLQLSAAGVGRDQGRLEFNFTDAPNGYGLPPFYSLHAWVWKDNPAGTFEMWNPSVHCDET
jgi:hypothetical protein